MRPPINTWSAEDLNTYSLLPRIAHKISQQYKDRGTCSLSTALKYLDSRDFNFGILLYEELVAVGALSARQLQVGFGPQHLNYA
jgi:hypothetical protein